MDFFARGTSYMGYQLGGEIMVSLNLLSVITHMQKLSY